MLMLNAETRDKLWNRVAAAIESYTTQVASLPITNSASVQKLSSLLQTIDFTRPMEALSAIDFAVEGLLSHHVHNAHPCYFGLFVPAPTTMGIAADTLVAAFNPALGAWHLSPIAVAIERRLIQEFGRRFGYQANCVDGAFTAGGAEANHTALLTALRQKFPEYSRQGLRAISSAPVLYTSAETHHSILKAAKLCGLGAEAVREIAVDADYRMDLPTLAAQVEKDKAQGLTPFMLIATAGGTSAGAIDPLNELAAFAAREKMWLHVDAAWGGAAILVPEYRVFLDGIHRADSITFDAHKWLSVPMGAGMYLTRHPEILTQTFRTVAPYMPSPSEAAESYDPYTRSMQWSRRFIGLKVFLSLAVAGWDGYAATIRHQTAMGDYLRQRLGMADWQVVNTTPLPLVCFTDAIGSPAHLEAIARRIVASGRAWISTVRIGNAATALRACITNYRTQPEDVDILMASLAEARAQTKHDLSPDGNCD
jgi:glutamate/tyrosine decarboxylase-like PLP-dependent enzyme